MSTASEHWIAQARAVPIEDEIARRGHPLKANGAAEREGPCPICGGEDRFSINIPKQVFNCRGCGKGGDVIAMVQYLDGTDFNTACEVLTGEPRPSSATPAAPRKVVTAQFEYHDHNGAIAFAVERIEFRNPDGSPVLTKDGKPKKTFRQKRPDPDRPGEWIRNVEGAPIVPYRLPELIEAIANGYRVVIVEGEAKADLLRSWNVPATCCAGGGKKWHAEHSAFLAGADAAILPDNDDAGREHADAVAESLQGIATSVRVLELPGLPPKGDVIDWAAAGGTVEALHRLIEQDARAWTPPAQPASSDATCARAFRCRR
jgi:DNA primase